MWAARLALRWSKIMDCWWQMWVANGAANSFMYPEGASVPPDLEFDVLVAAFPADSLVHKPVRERLAIAPTNPAAS